MTVLADTSAWLHAWRSSGRGASDFHADVADGRVATCDMVKFELLRGARNVDHLSELRTDLTFPPYVPIGPPEWSRAMDVFGEVVGRHGLPAIGHADLLIAAAAEVADLELVHHDRDFDRIAAITGQAVRWLEPADRA